eukprot:4506211-Prymnesium_polylepis.1
MRALIGRRHSPSAGWSSLDGGHNFVMGNLPGGAGPFEYVRRAGSRSEPAGLCFALMDAPPSSPTVVEDKNDDDGDAEVEAGAADAIKG